jgi:carbon-monoxide dehydrogenase iron sulfur subunit
MKRIYINEPVCMGCRLCEVYCQMEHSRWKDLVKAYKREGRSLLPSLLVEERRPVCFAVQCRHCADPVCVYACLTGALRRDSDRGVVTVDAEKCIGCWTCILACPFGAIRQDARQGRIVKCDLCAGRDMPACVANCPNEALVYVDAQDDAVNNAAISYSA